MAFTTLMMFQLFNVFNARSDERSAFEGLFTNRWLWAAVATVARACTRPWSTCRSCSRRFRPRALSAGDWLYCTAVASSVLWLRELSKVAVRATSARVQSHQISRK